MAELYILEDRQKILFEPSDLFERFGADHKGVRGKIVRTVPVLCLEIIDERGLK